MSQENHIEGLNLNTPEEALAALAAVVEGREDFIYRRPNGDTCCNVWDGKPSCIVGHVLVRAGVDIEWLGNESWWNATAADVCDQLDLPSAVAEVLGTAQDVQDDHKTWGEALQAAKDVARDYAVRVRS